MALDLREDIGKPPEIGLIADQQVDAIPVADQTPDYMGTEKPGASRHERRFGVGGDHAGVKRRSGRIRPRHER